MAAYDIQKRLAGQILKCSKNKIRFDQSRLEDIKEAITKADIRSLINDKAIISKPVVGISRARANKRKVQKSKGRQKGKGSNKGKKTARLSTKEAWMQKVRAQRKFLALLKEKEHVTAKDYQNLYRKSKGGFFRSVRHIKLYIEEHGMVKK